MLKLMILASTEDLDFMLAARYVEREYSRTRNKIIQKFNEFNLDGTYASKTPEEWVDDALQQINVGKTPDFPFYYSEMIERGSYIPSTSPRLGVYGVYRPEAYLDDTFTTPTWTIRGHDGSQYIMFGDATSIRTTDPDECNDSRDAAYLQYENEIYESIPASYKTENVPDFNWQEFFPGKFRETDYTWDEVTQISQPMFERWIAQNGADYRTNNTWSPEDRFT